MNKRNISGYILQVYQLAIRYDYNNSLFLEYFNDCITDENYNSEDDEDYITLGYYDRIEINPVYSFSKYHNMSDFAKRWIGKRQSILLYDISNKEYPCRLYYCKDESYKENKASNKHVGAKANSSKTHYWRSSFDEYKDVENKVFFCLTMLSVTNDVLSNNDNRDDLLKSVRERILRIIDTVNNEINDIDIACEVYGTFNTSEIAIVWLTNQYTDVLLTLEYIKHLCIVDSYGCSHNIFMTTYSAISIRSDLHIDEMDNIRGDAHLQLSFNDEQHNYKELEDIKSELIDVCSDDECHAESISSAGEYDCVISTAAKNILKLVIPSNGITNLLQIGNRDSETKLFNIDDTIRPILRHNTRLLIGSGENLELKQCLEVLSNNNMYIIDYPEIIANSLRDRKEDDCFLLMKNRLKYYGCSEEKTFGLREKIKELVNPSTGTVDTLDLLITDYQSVIATAYSKTWVEDIHTQFNGVLQSLSTLVESENTSSTRFWNDYRDLTNAFKQQIYHLAQSSRMFFETPSSHLRATGQYDFLMHAYYGIAKDIIESIYLIQEIDKQSELIPLITVNTEPQVISHLYSEYHKSDARIINLVIPNTVITDPHRGIVYLCHELYHYCVPADRVDRNYRLGVFALCCELKEQILTVLKAIMLESSPSSLVRQLDELLDFENAFSTNLFLNPRFSETDGRIGLISFDEKLMRLLFSKRYYGTVAQWVQKYADCQGGIDALKKSYLKLLADFVKKNESDEMFSQLFNEIFSYMKAIFTHNINVVKIPKQYEGAIEWVKNRFEYNVLYNEDSSTKQEWNKKVCQNRHYKQLSKDIENNYSMRPRTEALCKAIDEAHSDISIITLTGYSFTDYVLFFIKNICDLHRENNPDKLVIEEYQSLRFCLVAQYCFDEEIDVERNSNLLIGGKDLSYYYKVFPWFFLRDKKRLFNNSESVKNDINILQDYSHKWLSKVTEIYMDFRVNMYIFYHEIFKPILETANVQKRLSQISKLDCERGEKLLNIINRLNRCIISYRNFRNSLCEIDKISEERYYEILSNRFKIDLSIIQEFQNQKSLYQLRNINESISEKMNNKYSNCDREIEYVEIDGNVYENDSTLNRRFHIYSWNELQFYLDYCTRQFNKQLINMGYSNNIFTQIWYRGQTSTSEEEYKLWPLSYRKLHSAYQKVDDRNSQLSYFDYQRVQFEYFKTLVDGAPDAPKYGTLALCDYVALMQHYGLNTNLLDFTENAFIALYLALKYYSKEEINKNEKKSKEKQRDVCIYLVNPVLFNLYREKKMRGANNIKSGESGQSRIRGIIPNMSINRNEKRLANYIFGDDKLDEEYFENMQNGQNNKGLPPIAVWTPRINSRIRTQSGSFIAFDLYANVTDTDVDLMSLQEGEVQYAKKHGENPIVFLYKIEISKYACESILNTLCIMGMNQQFVYPELDKATQRFS